MLNFVRAIGIGGEKEEGGWGVCLCAYRTLTHPVIATTYQYVRFQLDHCHIITVNDCLPQVNC